METTIIGVPKSNGFLKRREYECVLEERKNLVNLFMGLSLPYKTVDSFWPRDFFVSHREKIHLRKKYGNYADGGYVLAFPKFVVALADISRREDDFLDSPDERYERLRHLYGVNTRILPNLNLRLNPNLRQHVDMVLLPIPKRGICFVDRSYYIENRDVLERFGEANEMKLLQVEHDYSKPTWPCNSLILENGGVMFAIVNSDVNSSFRARLVNYDVRPIDTPFFSNCRQGGGIHCATNSVPESFLKKADELVLD